MMMMASYIQKVTQLEWSFCDLWNKKEQVSTCLMTTDLPMVPQSSIDILPPSSNPNTKQRNFYCMDFPNSSFAWKYFCSCTPVFSTLFLFRKPYCLKHIIVETLIETESSTYLFDLTMV